MTHVSIYFTRGLVCGFAFESPRDFEPDLGAIDSSRARLEFLDTPDAELKRLIDPEARRLVNWSDIFEVELDGRIYYHILDIGDGDFIGIDEDKTIYEVRHDPFEVKPVRGNLAKVIRAYQTDLR